MFTLKEKWHFCYYLLFDKMLCTHLCEQASAINICIALLYIAGYSLWNMNPSMRVIVSQRDSVCVCVCASALQWPQIQLSCILSLSFSVSSSLSYSLTHMNNWEGRQRGRWWVRSSCWIIIQHLSHNWDSLPVSLPHSFCTITIRLT